MKSGIHCPCLFSTHDGAVTIKRQERCAPPSQQQHRPCTADPHPAILRQCFERVHGTWVRKSCHRFRLPDNTLHPGSTGSIQHVTAKRTGGHTTAACQIQCSICARRRYKEPCPPCKGPPQSRLEDAANGTITGAHNTSAMTVASYALPYYIRELLYYSTN